MTREEQIFNIAAQFAVDETDGQNTGKAASMCGLIFSAFKAGAQWADQHPQWIPVEEGLPEHCDSLLYTEPRNIYGPFEGRFRFGFYNYADQRWEIQGEKWDNTIVTHWIPIVPPRKQQD